MTHKLRATLLATTALGFLFCGTAQAAEMSTAESIKALQAQVDALQKQLSQIQAAAAAAPATATAESAKKEVMPGVNFKFGGFLATEAVWRDKNQTAGMDTSNNVGIPFANSPDASHDEFRGSVQSTRLNVLGTAKASENMDLAAFLEIDLSGSASTSNANKTNSYVPRLRHAYATINRSDWGLYTLVGQAFSLTTPFRSGLTARSEVGIQTIDTNGSAGFVYTRAPGVRFVKSFADKKAHLGLAFEAGQTYTGAATVPGTVKVVNPASGSYGSVGSYSVTTMPDVIAKLAVDTSFGHYELYGMGRSFRAIGTAAPFGESNAFGLSGGVSAFVPMFNKKVDLATNFTFGDGIGRYGAALLPDVAFTATGKAKPVTMLTGLVGVIGHVTPKTDLYTYFGAEKAMRQDYGSSTNANGYGSALNNNDSCYIQGSTLADCKAQTELVMQVSPGFWTKMYQGDYGTMSAGAQYTFARRLAFSGLNNKTPSANENAVMISFRYAPF